MDDVGLAATERSRRSRSEIPSRRDVDGWVKGEDAPGQVVEQRARTGGEFARCRVRHRYGCAKAINDSREPR